LVESQRRHEIFLFPRNVRTGSDARPSTYSKDVAGKETYREADHSPQSSAKFRNEWSYTSTPPVCFHGLDSVVQSPCLCGNFSDVCVTLVAEAAGVCCSSICLQMAVAVWTVVTKWPADTGCCYRTCCQTVVSQTECRNAKVPALFEVH
jgi:hypothetical protein